MNNSGLLKDKEVIYKDIGKNYRYEIRRAEKEGVYCEYYRKGISENAFEEMLRGFETAYNHMFEAKGIRNKFNRRLINQLREQDKVICSVAKIENKVLCYHAYIFDSDKSELMYSTSLLSNQGEDRNLIGRANKYLTWKDIVFLKENEFSVLDWGGISDDTEELSGITKFKMEFGGIRAEKISYFISNSWLGKFMLKAIISRNRDYTEVT